MSVWWLIVLGLGWLIVRIPFQGPSSRWNPNFKNRSYRPIWDAGHSLGFLGAAVLTAGMWNLIEVSPLVVIVVFLPAYGCLVWQGMRFANNKKCEAYGVLEREPESQKNLWGQCKEWAMIALLSVAFVARMAFELARLLVGWVVFLLVAYAILRACNGGPL